MLSGQTRHILGSIPAGLAGVRQTLKLMVSLVKAHRTNPDLRALAASIVGDCPQHNQVCEYTALQHWVRDHIRYLKDVNDVETIQWPEVTVRLGQGDCDDQAVLLATLLESIGYRARFEALGVRGGGYSHVVSAVSKRMANGRDVWVPLETIYQNDPLTGVRIEPGWLPPDTTSIMFAHIK